MSPKLSIRLGQTGQAGQTVVLAVRPACPHLTAFRIFLTKRHCFIYQQNYQVS